MQSLQQELHPKKIKISKLAEKLKLSGKMDLNFMEETLKRSSLILKKQPNVLSLESPVIIIGDIHGQFYDLLNILSRYSLETNSFLFLGDYVDRGQFCIEVISLLMVLKIQYPNSIHLLRGNHQSKNMTSQYNFKLQCCKKYSVDIYQKFLDWFKLLPLAAIVDKKYFCVHGGISPDFVSLNQLQRIRRNIQVPSKGLLCDLLWSDPTDDNDQTWEDNSIRGISYFYSRTLAETFLKKNDFKMIIRAHQLQDEGFKFQKNNKNKLNDDAFSLTLFSAPNYCDKFKNKGAIVIIKNNSIIIETFNEAPHPMILPDYMDVFQWTLPFIFTCVQHLFKNLIGRNKKRNSKTQDFKDIKKQLEEYQQTIIVKALVNKVLLQKNQPFPTKYSSENNQNFQLQQDSSTENQFKQNKENIYLPRPINCKFKKAQNQKIKYNDFQIKSPLSIQREIIRQQFLND